MTIINTILERPTAPTVKIGVVSPLRAPLRRARIALHDLERDVDHGGKPDEWCLDMIVELEEKLTELKTRMGL